MKKIIISVLAVVAFAFQGIAVEYTHSLIVTLTSGDKVEYQFADEPVMTFDGENLQLDSNAGNRLYQPVSEVVNITFAAEESGLDKTVAAEKRIKIAYDGATLAISGLNQATVVSVYSVAGVAVATATADADGAVSIPVDNLASGVYVASSKEHTFKFVKK